MNNGISFRKGDIIKVSQKITEGKRERTISFLGKVITLKGSGVNTMVTVRQTLEGIDVDRIFPLYAPSISSVGRIEERKTAPKLERPLKKTKSAKKKTK